MKIVLWIGNGANQKALANRIHSKHKVDLIIVESRKRKIKMGFSKILDRLADKLFFASLNDAWFQMLRHYEVNNKNYPDTQLIHTDAINNDLVYKTTVDAHPDLIIVSGTGMIREKLLSLKPRLGIMNLHTGLSPYVKGGPNCTNWCLATAQFHLIGNTIMWIDKGIDSGNIITNETTQFTGKESLADIHLKVMEHAHELYVRAIDTVVKGGHSSVSQDKIVSGKTYYTRDWNLAQKRNALANFKKFGSIISSGEYKLTQSAVKTVSFNI